jgi:hypothetical protein
MQQQVAPAPGTTRLTRIIRAALCVLGPLWLVSVLTYEIGRVA